MGNYYKPKRKAKTEREAERLVRKAASDWMGTKRGSATVKPTTRLSKLADIWLAEERLRGKLAKSSLDLYETELNVSEDKRYRSDAIKIKPTIGKLTIREADTARMNEYMVKLMEAGHTSKAARHWAILSGMFNVARRHSVIDHNPMDGTLKPDRNTDEPKAIEHEVFDAFMAQVRDWCAGKDIPGTPGWSSGPKRDERIYWIVQLFMDTGVRPGELLGFRKQDAELEADVPGIWVRGKLEDMGKGVGWRWQAGTKTGPKGVRRLAVSDKGVEAIRKLLAYGIDSDDNLIIPSPRGKGWNPSNFRGTWRDVRGTSFTDITPTQIRHRVGTDVRKEAGIGAAAAQLGNSEVVANKHYAARDREVDNRDALKRKSA
ncbi:tyrosine-type recombinase/integrase [Nocardia uniformis]|uniref:tyrosine-type recombinase/integrase n=1 Tax=Nocardia uniformis TaxID=53432 RepID=UPI0012FA2F73|nr:site-specific integrase [Nocardia uniformis]